jgi:X-Pro dipeptidyl-peptidase
MINLWISHELYGIENGAKELLPDVIVQDNVTPETWSAYQDWSEPNTQKATYHFAARKLVSTPVGHEVLSFKDSLPEDIFNRYADHIDQWEQDILAERKNDLSENRLLFKTEPIEADKIIDGRVHIHVKAASNQSFGMLSFQLVDYGEAKRFNATPTPIGMNKIDQGYRWREDRLNEFTPAKFATPFKMITKGHINLQNRENPWKVDELKPDQFYEIDIDLQPTFHRLAIGHQLGLVIYATDFGMTVRGNQDLRYSIDLSSCHLDVPFR